MQKHLGQIVIFLLSGLLLACQSPFSAPPQPVESAPSPAQPVASVDSVSESVQSARQIPSLPPPVHVEQYQSRRPKTILELQQYRETQTLEIRDRQARKGQATLVNLHPGINVWFLLYLEWEDGMGNGIYHLENIQPDGQAILLEASHPGGLILEIRRQRFSCDLWSGTPSLQQLAAQGDRRPYLPLCEGRLFLRNRTQGHKTSIEWATDFLRDNIWGGEQITVFVRETFYQDAFLDTVEVLPAESPGAGKSRARPSGAPLPATVNPAYHDFYLIPAELGIRPEYEVEGEMLVGRWYPVAELPGVFISTIQPKLVAHEIIEGQRGRLNPLDEIESSALVYLVAFDLGQFELGFSLGTEHPRVDWSQRIPESVLDPSLPGPDGIATVDPLTNTGMLNPIRAQQVVATFAGGFKRYHGAFRRGDLALKNQGTHYGFAEQGVIMSKLQPGLATFLVWEDGSVELKTWSEEDNEHLARLRHARQNGAPLIEYDAETGLSRPGALVTQPAIGNWSGSVDGRYRTLRAGVCLEEESERQFLIYGYFSSVTPSAMARVFQAYHCKAAMLTDMNALEHTYLAVYTVRDSQPRPQHLIRGMEVLDKSSQGQVVPRFVGYADNRDFFYLLKRGRP
jgi:hypothetical protein